MVRKKSRRRSRQEEDPMAGTTNLVDAMLVIAVGVLYVKAYMNMAQRNSKETEPKRHILLKIFGGFC